MDIKEAKEQLLKHKKEIDAKFISARYSKAIEVVLSELEKKYKIINQMVIYIMTHSSVPTLRHRFCLNYEREECKYNCDDTKAKSKCIIEYFTNKVEEDK